ncbi:competence protein CoiA [Agrobacterium sp. Azo12]|uniref:competence protein CoiA n=1 Tax=Agrobacterium sp. Azo12 TaxID=3031129 RepID=UPI0023D7EF81|nr:competence protein CoiA family protein [Agrobacterium sp. Azo12]MDO5895734.1 competence protein CoiA family protein [Agrobacterium sp. Azo12]
MKLRYALVDGERQEAQPKLRGSCPNCGMDVVAKCGQFRIWHWSHKQKLECDHWWEPETEWHRKWKGVFPDSWQEVIHYADDGERHIADVKTDTGLVIELQHSPISPDERLSREMFYKQMVWVVDGLRYKTDLEAFRSVVEFATILRDDPLYIDPRRKTGIFRRWAPLQTPVFIDFGDEQFVVAGCSLLEPVLWQFLLHPVTNDVVIAPVTRASFVDYCLNGGELRHLAVLRRPMPLRRPRYVRRYR